MEDFLQRLDKLSPEQRGLLESRLQQHLSTRTGLDGESVSDLSSRSIDDTAVSPLESALAGLWASVLQVRNVKANDDFVALGGDAQLAQRLIATVNTLFAVNLPIEFLHSGTVSVARMAQAIENARVQSAATRHASEGPQARAGTRILRRQRADAAVLSDTQKRMWFLARLDPANPAYNESRGYRLTGAIDVDALRRSVRYLARRHEILRTTYSLVDDEPRQVVHEDLAIELKCADLAGVPAAQQSEAMQPLLLGESQRPFSLEAESPLRILLVRLSEREHVLLRVIHHIAGDGWSSSIFDRELSAVYAAFAEGREPALPALPIQYADYAVWQREWLKGEVLKTQVGYWKQKLADLPTLELPTDRSRPPTLSYRGARATFDLPAWLSTALKALGRREGATLFMTLLAAFQVLLSRYSGQEDIAVGTAIAGRGRTELEGLIGFFANTLVLRTDLSGNPRFRELLARVRETALAAYTHQDLPFEKLVEELAPTRDMSRNPLFQVDFALQNAPGAALALAGVEVSRLPLEGHSAKFDLYLAMRESAEGLHGIWEYATDLFDAATIERMAGHFTTLLEAIVADPGQRIGELPLLSEPERHQLLVTWNDTAADYPRDRCIHQLFEEQVARTPEAVAVVFEDQPLTYGELNARANQLAHRLIGLGVGPEGLVGICLERSLDLIVGLIAILKAGGAYVPLDPTYPSNRLAFMLQDTQAPVLLTQHALVEQLPQYDGHLLCLDRDWNTIATQPDTNPLCCTTATSLAYVIYTSGSTGKPKGVMIEHRALVNHMVWMRRRFDLESTDSVLQKTPTSFDAAMWEFFAPLLVGGRLVMAPPGAHRDPMQIMAALRQHEVTTVQLVPSLFRLLVQEPGLLDCTQLTRVFCGGEALPGDSAQLFLERSRAHLYNLYGPTETCIDSLSWECKRENERTTVPIGRPIANTRVYVLDRYLSPVPVGVTGELCISGDGLARGYLNRAELTAEKFVPDPFSPVPGARMYRTGDRVRYLADGNIEFLGRIDDQVKIRGFRIEPGEIEAVLAEHRAVRQAVVLAREDAPGDKRLVAYVVPADASVAEIEPLRAFLRERLPEYMRPAAYVVLEHLPLTPNGKVDRKALPAPDAAPYTARGYEAPVDGVETTLAQIWAEVLQIERVGRSDNFFELGGHSLLAARLFTRLDRTFRRSLPLVTLFQAPTVRELARFYRDGAEPTVGAALVPICSTGHLPPLFAVPGIYGNVLGFADLARRLGPGQPFFGLQSVGLDGAREPLESIDEMAAHYLREVRQIQSRGPYYLLGACFGATVAFEMTHQLLKAGEEVAFLGLLDPSSLGGSMAGQPDLRLPTWLKHCMAFGSFIASRLQLYRQEMRALGFRQRLRFVRDKLQLVGEAVQKRDIFRGDRREFNQRRVYDANLQALLRYQHRTLTSSAVTFEVFATGRRFGRAPANSRVDWRTLSPAPIPYHRMPGKDSGDMLQGDNAQTLANFLSDRLQHARGA